MKNDATEERAIDLFVADVSRFSDPKRSWWDDLKPTTRDMYRDEAARAAVVLVPPNPKNATKEDARPRT